MKQPKTHQEKIEWYSVLHKQNLNGRETEDELFELGISLSRFVTVTALSEL
jgi:hypothetical protein